MKPTKPVRVIIKGLFDEVLDEILGMLKEQVFAFNEKFGKTLESRLQVSPGIPPTYLLDSADVITAYPTGGRVQRE